MRGVRVDVIGELKFLGKFKKKNWGGGGGGWVGGGGGWVGGGVGYGGCRIGGGKGGCDRRIEVFVKIKKNNIFLGGSGGGGGRVGGSGWK